MPPHARGRLQLGRGRGPEIIDAKVDGRDGRSDPEHQSEIARSVDQTCKHAAMPLACSSHPLKLGTQGDFKLHPPVLDIGGECTKTKELDEWRSIHDLLDLLR